MSLALNVASAFATWLQYVIYPSQSVTRLTTDVESNVSILPILYIWVPSIIIGLMMQVPTMHMFGIEWSNMGAMSVILTGALCLVVVAAR